MKKGMKKGLMLILTVVALSVCFVFGVSALSGECGDSSVWNFDEESGVLFVSGTGAIDGSLVFDEAIGDYLYDDETGEVVLDMPWAEVKNDIVAVVIEDGITSIGEGAFYGLYSLKSVMLPYTLKEIGLAAFSCCTNLENINIPDSVKVIGEVAIGETAIREFSFPEAIEGLPLYNEESEGFDFNMCCYLESITVPEGAKNLEVFVSPINTSLRSVYNRSMTSVALFDASGCYFDDSEIPKWFADEATAEFYGLSLAAALDSYIYDDEEYQAKYQQIFLEKLIEKYGENYAENIPELVYAEEVPSFITVYCYEGSAQEAYCKENGINYIIINPDHNCTDSDMSEKCDVCGANMCGENLVWTLNDGTLAISGTGAMYDYGYNEETATDNYPDYSKVIVADCSFVTESGPYVEKLIVEDGVTYIGNSAFAGLTELKDVFLPGTLTTIGCTAFAVCASLDEIEIPDSVTAIGEEAFNECTALESVKLSDSLERIEAMTFLYCTSLKEITMHENVKYIGDSAFALCSALESVSIENKDCEFADKVFYDVDIKTGELIEIKTVIRGHVDSTAQAYAEKSTAEGYPIAFEAFHTHFYEAGETTATCTEDGQIIYSCSCGDYYIEPNMAKGHSYGEWYRENEPTCTKAGKDRRDCSNCSHYESRSVGTVAHTMNGEYVRTESTCTANGVLVTYCTECGYEKTNAIEKLPHIDNDADGNCDTCGENIEVANCTCNCHKGGFSRLIWVILRIFYKLFKTNAACACGVAHY